MLSRVAASDLAFGAISPIFAFLIRDGTIKSPDVVAGYCLISAAACFFVFQWLRTSEPISQFFSIRDVLDLLKACILVVALSAAVNFSITRLDRAPRSIPILQFFVLVSALLAARLASRLRETRRETAAGTATGPVQHVLIVQASRLAWLFSKMIEELAPGRCQIAGILDERPQMQHRSLNGYPVVGAPKDLGKIVDEYALHGVRIGKVVAAGQPHDISDDGWRGLAQTCQRCGIELDVLPDRLMSGLGMAAAKPSAACSLSAATPGAADNVEKLLARPFWKLKRVVDFVIALMVAVIALPVTAIVIALAILDVGTPVVFWQQRAGRDGVPMRLYKFRTLATLFDRRTRERREAREPSAVGRLLRKMRLDEIPQLWNILSGDMSLIGPRPLLPVDQPQEPSIRLRVRPGLSGWAQVCGGRLISPQEKSALDEWYIRHASFRLDAVIVGRTIRMLLAGDRRDEEAIATAVAERHHGAIVHVPDAIAAQTKKQPKQRRGTRTKHAVVMRTADVAGLHLWRRAVAPAKAAEESRRPGSIEGSSPIGHSAPRGGEPALK